MTNRRRERTQMARRTNVKAKKTRHFGLQAKLGFSFSVLTIFISGLLTFALYQTVRGTLRQDLRQRLHDIANISALQIDGDAHATLVDPAQEGGETYVKIKRILQNIRDRGCDIRYVYTWRRTPDGRLVFVVDAETDPEEISHLGDVYDSAEPAVLAKLATLDHTYVDEELNADKWGVWLSGYAPLYRSDGQMEGLLGIDITASDVVSHERRFLWIALGVFAATIPLTSTLGWLVGRRLAAPITRLTAASERIAGGDLSCRVDITSNDEVGTLADSFDRMTGALQKTITSLDGEIAVRKKAEDALEVLNNDLQSTVQRLSQANRELREFAYIAAHDLKAPVRAIGSLADMISNDCRDTLNGQSRQQLDMLVQRTERMNEFISGILRYVTLAHAAVQKERVDMNEVVKDAMEQVGAPRETIEITVEDKLPVVAGHRTHLTQVFQNLLDNAVKYMDKPKGRIRIGCVDRDGYWQISVADNGLGIDQRDFDRIFQIFQTLNRRDKIEATGIGLSIVRKIVEQHGGRVWVESKPGEGSTFLFTLPKAHVRVENEERHANIVG